MAKGQRASLRRRVAVGVGLAHAALLWVLAHERIDIERRAEAPLEITLLIPPVAPHAMPPPAPARRPRSTASLAAAPPAPAAAAAASAPAAAVPAPSLAAAGARVASGFGPGRAAAEAVRGFGFPAARPRAKPPPTVFEEPSPRVGRTDRTAEGEQILWLTKDCYASLGSDSLILKDVHAFHRKLGSICQFSGPSAPRDDLFAPLKRPDPLLPPAQPGAPGQPPDIGR